MDRPIGRRDLLRVSSAGLLGSLAGCGEIADLFPESPTAEPTQQTQAEMITGEVLTDAGNPLSDVAVSALVRGGDTLTETTTDGDGQFRLSATRPVWLRVTADGYHERVTAARPGRAYAVTLTGEATATLCFGGDVMFGRRFTESPSDPLTPRFRIESPREDIPRALSYIAPVLQSGDITSVNLETPVTDLLWTHPSKTYAFRSHPFTSNALAGAGVDYAALGNNHAFDALAPGLLETREELAEADIAFSGAGETSDQAWEPAILERNGLQVAMLSCTTIAGANEDIDWSADRSTGGTYTVEQNGDTLTFADEVGVAEATESRLTARVETATENADVVVVQIHGGDPYQPTPTTEMRQLTEQAAAAGADLVVNHHPHVVGGIDRLDSTVVAWSLGNLVFDQKLWPTFPTYLLTAYVTATDIPRVTVEPLLIDGFVPKGVVGKPNDAVTWRAAQHTSRLGITNNGLDSAASGPQEQTQTFAGDGDIHARENGWVRGVEGGTVELGQDRLPTGTFESVLVDETGYSNPLWRYDRERVGSRPEFGYEDGGVRLRRVDNNSAPVTVSNTRRIPINGPITVTGLYRTTADQALELLVTWYPNTRTSELGRERWELDGTGGDWERIRLDLRPRELATHVNILFRLFPPGSGEHTADIDNLGLIEWDETATAGRHYDHLRATEDATVRFAANGDVRWSRLPEQ